MKYLALAAFAGSVVASNVLTLHFGMLFGLVAVGTFTAGLAPLVRDWLRESAGQAWVYAGIAIGAVASAGLTFAGGGVPDGPSATQLALASAAAFTLSELADSYIYEPLRQRGKLRASAVSNVVGSVVDSLLFLALAGFPIWPAIAGQISVKWVVSVIPVIAVASVTGRRATT